MKGGTDGLARPCDHSVSEVIAKAAKKTSEDRMFFSRRRRSSCFTFGMKCGVGEIFFGGENFRR